MSGIAKKLLLLIGDSSVQSWADKMGLPTSTVHEWIKHDRMPGTGNLKLLTQSTGMPKEWWTDGRLADVTKSKNQVNQTTVQYEGLKVYQDNVVKLNARPKLWLEEIINYFVSLPEDEQQKIRTYSKDLYEKVKNYDQRKKVNITISGLVEIPMTDDDDGNSNESKGNV